MAVFSPCLIRVKRHPFLFSKFLNDLEDYFCQLGGIPLENIRDKLESELHVYYKLFVMLYADDTFVILSESKDGLQKALDIFESYCEIWKLQVNVNKVMIFCKKKFRHNFGFSLQGQFLEIVAIYSYLGAIFKYNGTF
jgi:hypothetical protein